MVAESLNCPTSTKKSRNVYPTELNFSALVYQLYSETCFRLLQERSESAIVGLSNALSKIGLCTQKRIPPCNSLTLNMLKSRAMEQSPLHYLSDLLFTAWKEVLYTPWLLQKQAISNDGDGGTIVESACQRICISKKEEPPTSTF